MPQYLPALVAVTLSLGFCGVFVILARFFGPRRWSAVKATPFECGSDPVGSPRARYSVKFYQIAILFLVFDIESAFMYPWVVQYRELSLGPGGGSSLLGFGEMLTFVAVLGAALAYVWKKKAIGWD
jgi:NADH-quinone oxidoreductase subunit A